MGWLSDVWEGATDVVGSVLGGGGGGANTNVSTDSAQDTNVSGSIDSNISSTVNAEGGRSSSNANFVLNSPLITNDTTPEMLQVYKQQAATAEKAVQAQLTANAANTAVKQNEIANDSATAEKIIAGVEKAVLFITAALLLKGIFKS